MNWTREQLKSNAKLMIKKNWLCCGLVSFILVLVGQSTGGFDFNYNFDLVQSPPAADPAYGHNAIQFSANNLMGGLGTLVVAMMPYLGIALTVVAFLLLLGFLFDIFVGNVLVVGSSRFYLHNIHSKGEMDDMLFGFRNCYGNVTVVMLWRSVFTFLWTLLLIVPGIIKQYEYRMVPYILADNPELDTTTVLDMSKDMMYGEKWNAFVLDLSFILWNLLAAVTWGIAGVIWVNPYKDATNAELYTALKVKNGNGYTE